ncbi:MAG: COG1361 S-layer family protein [Candidatus Woesearchaeota archaeon]
MRIKNFIINKFLLVSFLMLIFCMGFVFAQISNSDALRISLVNQEPDPAEPGRYVDVRFMLENIGSEDLDDIEVEFLETYPFTLDQDDALKKIGKLASFQKDQNALIIKYKVRVDNNAIEGENTLKLRLKKGDGDWLTYSFDIRVRVKDATLSLEQVTTNPSPILPGSDSTISLKVKNLAESPLKDISVILDLTLLSFGTQNIEALPFAPMDSGKEKKIWKLNSKEEAIFNFNIRAYPSAESRVYKIPVVIKYYDLLGNEFEKNDLIGVVVNSESQVGVVLDDTDIKRAKTKGDVSFKFVNKGLGVIKFLNVEIEKSEDFEILSSNNVYLGNIDSDDFDFADFNIYVKEGVEELMIPIKYEFFDSNNNKYEMREEIKVNLFTEERLNELGFIEEKNNLPIIILVVVLILGFVIYRFYRRCKK